MMGERKTDGSVPYVSRDVSALRKLRGVRWSRVVQGHEHGLADTSCCVPWMDGALRSCTRVAGWSLARGSSRWLTNTISHASHVHARVMRCCRCVASAHDMAPHAHCIIAAVTTVRYGTLSTVFEAALHLVP